MEIRALVERCFALAPRTIFEIDAGWDSHVFEIDGEWIVRVPRRPEVTEWMRREIELLPELARALTVPIPEPELVALEPVCFGYRKLRGVPLSNEAGDAVAADAARFLTELHGFSVERARALGVPGATAAEWRASMEELLTEFEQRVFPLLRASERSLAAQVFAGYLDSDEHFAFAPTLVHADLGPAHLLCERGRLSGVIDWSDARIGDPALDFAWLLYGTAAPFGSVLLEAYEGSGKDAIAHRALLYHRLGPWHEVVYGLETGRDEYVASGLEGVRSRLGHREPATGPRRKIQPAAGR